MTDHFYYYTAKQANGRNRRGFLFASDLRQLKHIAHLKQLQLLSGKKIPLWLSFLLRYLFKISQHYRTKAHAQSVFFRHLTNLIDSGMSLHKAVESLLSQEKNKLFLRSLAALHEGLTLGNDLSHCIAHSFPFLKKEYQLILTGCSDTNSIKRIFLSISHATESRQTQRFTLARITVVFLFTFGTSIAILAFYTKIWLYNDRLMMLFNGKEPSFMYETFFQLFSGRIITNWHYLFVILTLVAIMISVRLLPRAYLLWKKALLYLPIIGEGLRARSASSLFFYLDLQTQGGKTLQQSLSSALRLMKQTPFYAELSTLNNGLMQGYSFQESIQPLAIFSNDEKSLLTSSLSGNALEESLSIIRRYLDKKLKTRMIIIRESLRFFFIVILLTLYGWALYTYLYHITGYVWQ